MALRMNGSTARTRILKRISQALGRDSDDRKHDSESNDAAFRRLVANATKGHEALSAIANPVAVFTSQAKAVGAHVVSLDAAEQVPDWLQNSPFGSLPVALSNQIGITALEWSHLNIDADYKTHGQVGVVKASMAAAETGTVLLDSHSVASGLLYLVDRLVVLLDRAHIKERYEDLWAVGPQKSPIDVPRAVHLITGPSRTADVEQTIQVGAHGPREVYIIVLANEGRSPDASDPEQ